MIICLCIFYVHVNYNCSMLYAIMYVYIYIYRLLCEYGLGACEPVLPAVPVRGVCHTAQRPQRYTHTTHYTLYILYTYYIYSCDKINRVIHIYYALNTYTLLYIHFYGNHEITKVIILTLVPFLGLHFLETDRRTTLFEDISR